MKASIILVAMLAVLPAIAAAATDKADSGKQRAQVVYTCTVNGKAVDPKECPEPPEPPEPPALPDLPPPPPVPPVPPVMGRIGHSPVPPVPPVPPVAPLPQVPEAMNQLCEGKAAGEEVVYTVENQWTLKGSCRQQGKRMVFRLESLLKK